MPATGHPELTVTASTAPGGYSRHAPAPAVGARRSPGSSVGARGFAKRSTPRRAGMSMLTSAEDSAAPGTLIRIDRMPGRAESAALVSRTFACGTVRRSCCSIP